MAQLQLPASAAPLPAGVSPCSSRRAAGDDAGNPGGCGSWPGFSGKGRENGFVERVLLPARERQARGERGICLEQASRGWFGGSSSSRAELWKSSSVPARMHSRVLAATQGELRAAAFRKEKKNKKEVVGIGGRDESLSRGRVRCHRLRQLHCLLPRSFLPSAEEQSVVFPAGQTRKPKTPRFLFQVGQEMGGRAGVSTGCSGALGCPRPKTQPRLPPLCAAPGSAAAPGWGRRVSGRPREATSCRKAGAKGNGDREQPKCPWGCYPGAHGDGHDPSLGAGERPHAGLCAADVVVAVVIAVYIRSPACPCCV